MKTITRVITGVYIRSEIRAVRKFAASEFGLIPAFLAAASPTFFIGTMKPMTRLISVLTRKLMRKPCHVNCPDRRFPVRESPKLMVTPISMLINIPIFLSTFILKIPPFKKLCLLYHFAPLLPIT